MTAPPDDKETVLKSLLAHRAGHTTPYVAKHLYFPTAPEPSDARPTDEDDDGHTES